MKPYPLGLPLAILLTTAGFGPPSQSAGRADKPAAAQPPASTQASAPTQPSAAGPRDDAAIARGQKTYTKVGCYQCHGREGQGSPASGPRIGPAPPALAAFLAYVRAPAGEMPPYTTKVLSDADLTDIRAFLDVRAPAVHDLPVP